MSDTENTPISTESVFSLSLNDVVASAFRKMAVIQEDETPTDGMYRTGFRTLNLMMKELEATGIHIWTEEECVLFLQAGQPRYLLGPGSTDNYCDAYSFAMGQLTANAAEADTVVTVNLGTIAQPAGPVPFAIGMNFGITLDTGYNFWTTLTGVAYGDSTAALTFADALPSSASADNFSFGYVERTRRPLRVPAARRLAYLGLILTPLTRMMSRQEYMDLPQPYSLGQVTQAFYNPARDVGQIYCWNNPQNATQGLRFTYYRPLFNFSNPADKADLPDEWGNTLIWNLAKELLPDYSVPATRRAEIKEQAGGKFDLVSGWDREPQSVLFGVGYDQTSRRR